MKLFVFYGRQPCLEIKEEKYGRFGVNRDRQPDSGWGEMHSTTMEYAKEIEMTDELKITLLEDLAYAYGSNSKKFREKLIEFKFV